jgi:hypothetical protein
MHDVPQDGLIRSLRLMAPMFGHGPREDNARYAADELERVILEKRHLIGEIQRLSAVIKGGSHGPLCAGWRWNDIRTVVQRDRDAPCDCWKAHVL